MSNRKVNFSAGPAMLPNAVMAQIEAELWDYKGTGVSIMEMGHRTPLFDELVIDTEQKVRQLLEVPDNYHVLFMHGGASHQFPTIPLNLLQQGDKADYLVTGIWSQKSAAEAARLRDAQAVDAVINQDGNRGIANLADLTIREDIKYLYYCPNETVAGLAFDGIPEFNGDLVADYTSAIMAEPIDISRYGLIFAGAQKNLGIAGITLVIVRDDLLNELPQDLPVLWHYKTMIDERGLYNTPPTFAWYVSNLMVNWMQQQGGLAYFKQKNQANADLVYNFVDQSDFYFSDVIQANRSILNVPFILRDESLNNDFLAQAEAAGLTALKGHRSVGGMRASMYNAMPTEAVHQLVDFMQTFANKNQ